jgi:hypothetical protein
MSSIPMALQAEKERLVALVTAEVGWQGLV